ncbi:MAG: hypothetical protein KGM15_09505 [Pseudomonadota bacterium]|nr:hypothetical protein [Pseudomonadota bacterium]
MKRFTWAVAAMVGAGVACATPAAALPGCDAFLQKMRAEGGEIGLDYSRALVVSRVHSTTVNYDINTHADVDGTLTCQGDQFKRFEAHVLEPMRGKAAEGFERLQQIAMKAALGWDGGKARNASRGLAGEAKEYLSASRQRGDVYVAGKTEQHEPGGVGVGMIFTEIDRAFVIVAEN